MASRRDNNMHKNNDELDNVSYPWELDRRNRRCESIICERGSVSEDDAEEHEVAENLLEDGSVNHYVVVPSTFRTAARGVALESSTRVSTPFGVPHSIPQTEAGPSRSSAHTVHYPPHTASHPRSSPHPTATRTGHTSPSPTTSTNATHVPSSQTTKSIANTTRSTNSAPRHTQLGAATPDRPLRRSTRGAAQRTSQLLHAIFAPRNGRRMGSIVAADNGGPLAAVPSHHQHQPARPPPIQNAARVQNHLNGVDQPERLEEEEEDKPRPSAKALGKRRRATPDCDADDEKSDDDEGRWSKRTRRDRSTSEAIMIKKEEPTSPILSQKRKLCSGHDVDERAGPSKKRCIRCQDTKKRVRRTPAAHTPIARRQQSKKEDHRERSASARQPQRDANTPIQSPGPPNLASFLHFLIPPAPYPIPHPPHPHQPAPLRRTYAKYFVRL